MFKSILKKKVGCTGGRTRPDLENNLGYACYRTETKKGKVGIQIQASFLIGRALMKKARFIEGDRLDLQKDEGLGLLVRVTNGNIGGKISSATSKKYSKVSFSQYPELVVAPHAFNLDAVAIVDEGIIFEWPKDNS